MLKAKSAQESFCGSYRYDKIMPRYHLLGLEVALDINCKNAKDYVNEFYIF
jgi:hypothetical protein